MKKKNNMISRLEEKTNQITATMKQLEQRWETLPVKTQHTVTSAGNPSGPCVSSVLPSGGSLVFCSSGFKEPICTNMNSPAIHQINDTFIMLLLWTHRDKSEPGPPWWWGHCPVTIQPTKGADSSTAKWAKNMMRTWGSLCSGQQLVVSLVMYVPHFSGSPLNSDHILHDTPLKVQISVQPANAIFYTECEWGHHLQVRCEGNCWRVSLWGNPAVLNRSYLINNIYRTNTHAYWATVITTAPQSVCVTTHLHQPVRANPPHLIVCQSTWSIPAPPLPSPIGLNLLHSICDWLWMFVLLL